MDSINARIRQIREKYCEDSNKDFARRLEKGENTVNNYVREKYSVGKGVVSDILKAFPIGRTALGEQVETIIVFRCRAYLAYALHSFYLLSKELGDGAIYLLAFDSEQRIKIDFDIEGFQSFNLLLVLDADSVYL